MKRITILLLLVMFVVVGCGESSPKPTSSRPEWIDLGANSPNQVSAVGVGYTKLGAVAMALTELSRDYRFKTENLVKILSDTSGTAFDELLADSDPPNPPPFWVGNVKVEYFEKGSFSEGDFYQITSKISIGDSLSSYELKVFEEGYNENKYSNHIEATGKNLNFASLLHEMKEAGLKMETYEDEEAYYVLLIMVIQPNGRRRRC